MLRRLFSALFTSWLCLACGDTAGGETPESVSAPRKGTASAEATRAPGDARSNVVLVVVDTLRADHLSHYGYGRATGKGLDELAEHATRFTHAYAPASWTSPSIASLFTGMTPVRHGVERLGQSLPTKWRTLAEELRAHGWTGVGHSFNHVITRKTRYHRGFAVFEGYHVRAGSYGDVSDMMQRAKLWLDNGPRPFFLYLQPMNVHGPYLVPGRAAKALLGRRPSHLFRFYGGIATAILDGKLDLRAEFSPTHLESLTDQYDTAIRYTADQLGGLFKHLKKLGLYDDALIIVTSDHGEELFDHGGFSHGHTLYEEVVRIPLYVKLPGQRKAKTVDDWVRLYDVYPTILDALGIEPSAALDGKSFLDRMRGEGERREEKMLFVSTLKKSLLGRGLSWQGFKLVQIDKNYEGVQNEVRLYDLEKDPGEREDVAARYPKIVAGHAAEIERLLAEYGKGKGASKTELSGSEMKQLKALGYAQ